MEDFEIIQEIRKGNLELFDKLVDNNIEAVTYFVLRIVKNNEDAEDIVQDAFVKAYEKLHTFKGDSKFKTWLFSIALNLARQHLRKRKLFKFFAPWTKEAESVTDKHLPEKEIIRKENKKILEEAIDELPDQQRTVFMLRQNDKLKYDEIAQILNININTAKTNYFFAVRNLRRNLTEKGVKK